MSIDVLHNTDDLRKLINQYPEYPIAVLAGRDANGDDYWGWMFCSSVTYSVGEILDCHHPIENPYWDTQRVYTDRDEFEEDYADWFASTCDEEDWVDTDGFNDYITEQVKQYDKYWKPCILIYVDN